MLSFLLLLSGCISVIYACLRGLECWTQGPQEPPLVTNTIPFFGSIFQMMKHKTRFYMRMNSKHGFPIYTLRVPGSRLYVVNSVPLIATVQKQYRTLSWAPLMGSAISWISGTSEATNDIMARDLESENGFLLGINKATFPDLLPGPALDAMNKIAIGTFAKSMDSLASGGPHRISFFSWVRSQIVLATTDAIYGPHNPFRIPGVEEAWNNYRPGIPNLGPKALPSFLTTKSMKARELVVKALMDYFQAGHHEKGSKMVLARYKYIVDKHQIRDLSDLARLELSGAFASIENTVPTTFWFLYRIFSDPVTLHDCRKELAPLIQEHNGIHHIDVDSIKASCPVFQSTLHETIRYHSITISARKVTEDYTLDRYLLKKGSTVLISATVPHFDKSTWGDDAGIFRHTRFVQPSSHHEAATTTTTTTGGKGLKRTAFRGFGGGYHLCPGRHFSVTEMLSLAAMLILRFDATPATGTWDDLGNVNVSSSGTAAPIPDHEIPVMLHPRSDKEWEFFVSGTGKKMELLTES